MAQAPYVTALREEIIGSGYVLDPEGTHHEFVSGMHGRKLDFDNIDDQSPLYEMWVDATAAFIETTFPRLPEIVIGVANGTNRVALDVACNLGNDVIGMVSKKEKEDSKKLYISSMTAELIRERQPDLVVVKEDVGTTGSNSVQVALACLEAGAREAHVVTTWKRRPELEKLDAAGVPYTAMIDEPLDTYTPEACQAEGFCSQGWEFIERSK